MTEKREEAPFVFRFDVAGQGNVMVAVSQNHYYKGVSQINKLRRRLRREIPFPFKMVHEPVLNVLGGRSHKGQLSLEMVIAPQRMSEEQAIVKLKEKAFIERMEHILG